MTVRKRFGVSLEQEVFEELERMTKALGTDRSRLISIAAREYLTEKLHFARRHECEGVLIASYTAEVKNDVDKLLEESNLIVSRTHLHSRGGCCVEVLYLRGSSDSVWSLQAAVTRVSRACRYVPMCI